MAYDKPERTTAPEHAHIVDKLDIEGASVMPSDNGGWLWLRVSRSGHSWSHRLPLEPEHHHIAEARRQFDAWWIEERSPEDLLADTISKGKA